MRTYLVDASNATRRSDYAEGFPEMDDLRAREFVERLSRDVRPDGRIHVELIFDGPRRELGSGAGLSIRFSGDQSADAVILGTVRSLRSQGRGVIVVTEDALLRREILEEGGKVLRFGELFARLRDGKA